MNVANAIFTSYHSGFWISAWNIMEYSSAFFPPHPGLICFQQNLLQAFFKWLIHMGESHLHLRLGCQIFYRWYKLAHHHVPGMGMKAKIVFDVVMFVDFCVWWLGFFLFSFFFLNYFFSESQHWDEHFPGWKLENQVTDQDTGNGNYF